MNETYVECLVARKPSMILKFFSVLCTMLAVVFFLVGLVYIFAWVVALAAGIGAYVLNGRCNTEYEYLYVDREISVDRILAKNRRKKVGTYTVDRMEILAPINSYRLDSYKNRQTKNIDYSVGVAEQPDRRYVLYYEGGIKLILNPSPEFIKAIQNVAPRKVFTD